jgi:hypothetical protein
VTADKESESVVVPPSGEAMEEFAVGAILDAGNAREAMELAHDRM